MSYSVDQLQAGQTASFSKTITEHDVYTFAGVTGDLNPAHINEPFARQTQFHGRIAHGMLSAGLISAVIGMHLPGPGTIYLGQELPRPHWGYHHRHRHRPFPESGAQPGRTGHRLYQPGRGAGGYWHSKSHASQGITVLSPISPQKASADGAIASSVLVTIYPSHGILQNTLQL